MTPESDLRIQERLTQYEKKIQRVHDSVELLHEQFNHLFVALLTAGLATVYFAVR
jgi:hypothetical protein